MFTRQLSEGTAVVLLHALEQVIGAEAELNSIMFEDDHPSERSLKHSREDLASVRRTICNILSRSVITTTKEDGPPPIATNYVAISNPFTMETVEEMRKKVLNP